MKKQTKLAQRILLWVYLIIPPVLFEVGIEHLETCNGTIRECKSIMYQMMFIIAKRVMFFNSVSTIGSCITEQSRMNIIFADTKGLLIDCPDLTRFRSWILFLASSIRI